jgi:lysozyme|tara:strand:- start:1010 stop:1465 length:456 start_codon:yes stop_codon:yes gene_type:complete
MNNDLKTSQEGISLIKSFEGCELTAYRCSADVPTIGYGHTAGVSDGDTCTQEEAETMLAEDLVEFEDYVKNYVEPELQQNEFDALVAWTYNLGPANLKESTMLKELNSGNFEEVPRQMKRWNRAGGEVLDGLIRRREAESRLFKGEAWEGV